MTTPTTWNSFNMGSFIEVHRSRIRSYM